MTDKQRAAKVLELLAERYPDLETHLMAESPWELLVATVLAAQCTDKRVNQVTPELFRRWPDPAALAQATIPELEEVIHSVGFYHSKAKHLIAAAQLVVKEFNGETPNTMKDLINVGGPDGQTVLADDQRGLADTHVAYLQRRLTHLIPWTEKDLVKLFPQSEWGKVNHRMVWFGRHVCDARKPLCDECEMAPFCPKVGVE
ncbi:MAG: endonuclease III domain-containing protein [Bilophila wadsworthia]